MKRIATLTILLAVTFTAMAQDATKKYEIKSGIAKTVTSVMGQQTESMSYFDDFGALEMSKTKTIVPGAGEMEIATVSKEGKMYMVNYSAKQVQEIPAQESVNYLNITEAIKEQYKIKEIGTEKIGERECLKYSMEVSQMGQTATVTTWIYKGFPLKSVTAMGRMEIVSEVIEFTEDAYVLPQTFEIPEF